MTTFLRLTTHDPLVARDGRPFGIGQGNRMRGLPWPLPSVVAGSFRTALVKAGTGDFSGDTPERLKRIAVAGVFPVHNNNLYLPAPNDCAWDEKTGTIHRVQPIQLDDGEGVDFPPGSEGLWPVRLCQDQSPDDFKARAAPAWWPQSKLAQWLTSSELKCRPDWFSNIFLNSAVQSVRDHIKIDADRGAAEESKIYASSNLNLTHLPRFGVKLDDGTIPLNNRFAEVSLSARVEIPDTEAVLRLHSDFDIWHPLGGERRLVHWKHLDSELWKCPDGVNQALKNATRIRMVLATPAVLKGGWIPDLVNGPLKGFNLKLVGASTGRWKAVSGWSLADMKDQPRGPKPIRRLVPVGSVYFFTVDKPGDAARLADLWLQSVSEDDQERRDGFGLAVWGIW